MTAVATRTAPAVAAAYAEWFTGPHPDDAAEVVRLTELAAVHERVREAQAAVADQLRSFGLDLSWQVAVRPHWSRGWEYPFILRHGGFKSTDDVLDVGGSGSLLPYRVGQLTRSVSIADPDPQEWLRVARDRVHRRHGKDVTFYHHDGAALPWKDGAFDKVVCCSVLEHTADPLAVVRECWRVLRPGGRLLVTLDVADYVRWNHTVDVRVAADILHAVGVLPGFGRENPVGGSYEKAVTARIPELDDRRPGDKPEVTLRVLGFYADKAG